MLLSLVVWLLIVFISLLLLYRCVYILLLSLQKLNILFQQLSQPKADTTTHHVCNKTVIFLLKLNIYMYYYKLGYWYNYFKSIYIILLFKVIDLEKFVHNIIWWLFMCFEVQVSWCYVEVYIIFYTEISHIINSITLLGAYLYCDVFYQKW